MLSGINRRLLENMTDVTDAHTVAEWRISREAMNDLLDAARQQGVNIANIENERQSV